MSSRLMPVAVSRLERSSYQSQNHRDFVKGVAALAERRIDQPIFCRNICRLCQTLSPGRGSEACRSSEWEMPVAIHLAQASIIVIAVSNCQLRQSLRAGYGFRFQASWPAYLFYGTSSGSRANGVLNSSNSDRLAGLSVHDDEPSRTRSIGLDAGSPTMGIIPPRSLPFGHQCARFAHGEPRSIGSCPCRARRARLSGTERELPPQPAGWRRRDGCRH